MQLIIHLYVIEDQAFDFIIKYKAHHYHLLIFYTHWMLLNCYVRDYRIFTNYNIQGNNNRD